MLRRCGDAAAPRSSAPVAPRYVRRRSCIRSAACRASLRARWRSAASASRALPTIARNPSNPMNSGRCSAVRAARPPRAARARRRAAFAVTRHPARARNILRPMVCCISGEAVRRSSGHDVGSLEQAPGRRIFIAQHEVALMRGEAAAETARAPRGRAVLRGRADLLAKCR